MKEKKDPSMCHDEVNSQLIGSAFFHCNFLFQGLILAPKIHVEIHPLVQQLKTTLNQSVVAKLVMWRLTMFVNVSTCYHIPIIYMLVPVVNLVSLISHHTMLYFEFRSCEFQRIWFICDVMVFSIFQHVTSTKLLLFIYWNTIMYIMVRFDSSSWSGLSKSKSDTEYLWHLRHVTLKGDLVVNYFNE